MVGSCYYGVGEGKGRFIMDEIRRPGVLDIWLVSILVEIREYLGNKVIDDMDNVGFGWEINFIRIFIKFRANII